MKKHYNWKSLAMKAFMVIAGLILIIIGNNFDKDFLKVSVDGMLANIGALLMLVGILQWIFDEAARNELILEIVKTIKGDNELQANGVVGCLSNSREIKDIKDWQDADLLVVGAQYSARFIEDRHTLIAERIRNKKITYFCCNESDSNAVKYLKDSSIGTSDINQKLAELERRVTSLNGANFVKIFKVATLFRYSFIYTEKSIWIRFFTNANVYCSELPALKIKSSTPFFKFFHTDIKNMGIPL